MTPTRGGSCMASAPRPARLPLSTARCCCTSWATSSASGTPQIPRTSCRPTTWPARSSNPHARPLSSPSSLTLPPIPPTASSAWTIALDPGPQVADRVTLSGSDIVRIQTLYQPERPSLQTMAANEVPGSDRTHQPWALCGPHAHQPWAPFEGCLAGLRDNPPALRCSHRRARRRHPVAY